MIEEHIPNWAVTFVLVSIGIWFLSHALVMVYDYMMPILCTY